MNYTGILFLYFFLPLFFGLYAIASVKARPAVMTLGSCTVIAWAQPFGLIPFGTSILMGYYFGRMIGRYGKKSAASKLLLAVCITVQIVQTIVFCSFSFTGMELFSAFGCCIYSLHTISLCFDIYRGDAQADTNFFHVSAYIGFLPSLCGIPVVNYKKISEQIKNTAIKSDMLANGIQLLLLGIAEKVIVSDRLTEIFYELRSASTGSKISIVTAWLGAFLFACSVYTKLKGYSNIARGFAMMLGFDIGISFSFPISRLTLREYVNSYNISAAGFVREYIHRPIEGKRPNQTRLLIALSVSITVLCVSYCPSVRFLIWGMSAALLVVLELLFEEKLSRIPRPVRYIITHMMTLIGWAFVSQDSTASSLEFVSNMFAGVLTIDFAPLQYYLFSSLPYLLIMILFEVKPIHTYYNRLNSGEMNFVTVFKPFTTFVLLLLCTVFLMSGVESYTSVGIGGA